MRALAAGHGPFDIVRGGIAALRVLGPAGLLHRAAAAVIQRDEDARYQAFRADHAGASRGDDTAPTSGPLISIVTPVFNTPASLLEQCIDAVVAQTYASWEWILADDGSTDAATVAILARALDPRITVVRAARNLGIVGATNLAIAQARGEFLAFLDHDDALAPDALAEIARQLRAAPATDVVYTDEDKIDGAGVHCQPHFKPDWSPELLDSCMYVSHLTAIRRTLVEAAGRLRDGYDGSQDYDLLLRVAERTSAIAHVRRVLYGWRMAPGSAASSQLAKPWAVAAGARALEDAVRRRGTPARIVTAGAAGHFRVQYEIAGDPVVSVLLVGGDAQARASAAARLVRTVAGRRFEIVEHEASAPGSSLATQLNALAARATGAHLLVLDAGVEPVHRGWLDALLEFSQHAAIGAVGPFLLRADGTVDDAGLVVGVGSGVEPALHGAPGWTRGHLSNALDVRNCTAVSAACLLTRRDAFDAAGGFDAGAGDGVFAVDYGLRLRAAGLRLVVTPHARMRRRDAGGGGGITVLERDWLQARWGDAAGDDPYYNPAFDRRAATWRLPPPDSLIE